MGPVKELSQGDIKSRIAAGQTVVLVDGYAIRADQWLQRHPGGSKIILHMVGRDATDEVNAYHSEEARKLMDVFRIGRVQGGHWKNLVPPFQGGSYVEEDEGVVIDDSLESERDVIVPKNGKPPSRQYHDMQELKGMHADLDKYPSLDPVTQSKIIQKYRQLDRRLQADGYYKCTYTGYARECAMYVLLALISYYFLTQHWYMTSAFFLGLLWHQLVFTAHDAGHMGITHSFAYDTLIGIVIADFIGGLSLGWWKNNHNVHHVVTNHPEHDPDIQHMPFFAVSSRFLNSVRSTYYNRVLTYDPVAKFFIKLQPYTYYPILCFGRFNLYRLSWQYLLFGEGSRKGITGLFRYLEIAGMVFFWYWFGYLLLCRSIPSMSTRIMYVLVSHIVTMPLHVQIALSHFAMSTSDLGVAESFPQKMLRTTMDVDCPPWLDFLHGGLQFQAVHHLFPRIPRHNLRNVQPLVREYCKDVGIDYCIYGFHEGNKEVINRLDDIAQQAKVLEACARKVARDSDFH